jgi:hypothetical protein
MVDKVIKPGEIFVFGSNEKGIHGAGAAREALEKYGAVLGKGFGHWGNSFAIPTVGNAGRTPSIGRTLPLTDIDNYVQHFKAYARWFRNLEFFVTRIGCGLACYKDEDIGPLFAGAPDNCELPHGWR